jgi:hypothetical protein
MRKRWALLFFLFISTTSIFGQGTSSSMPAQEGAATVARTVQLDAMAPDAPAKIVKVMLNGTEVKPGVPFQAGDDWFNRLQVVIKNMSRKNIVFAAGQLRFPETGDASAEHLAIMDRFSIGRRPEDARASNVTSPPGAVGLQAHVDGVEILVVPGQETAVSIVDPFDHIKAGIEVRQPLSSVTTSAIGLHTLYFDDGTTWLSGLYFRADPSTPGRYIRISQKEFESSNREASQ